MHAAVVIDFDHAPRYGDRAEPEPRDGEEVVEVVAAALHPRVRSQADGSHYTSTNELPLVPGIDGVGRRADGSLVYFVLPDTRFGSMAERVAIDVRRSVSLGEGADPVPVAAAMNPAMSSWIALRRRARITPGQSVLVLGATGSAGRLAIQVARRLGASRIVAVGRNQATLETLTKLGADTVVSLRGDLDEAAARVGEAAADVDIVVDYLFGLPAHHIIPALLTRRADRGAALTWVQVGAVAGPDLTIASALLRAANFSLMGSGQGSVSTAGIVEELRPLMSEIASGAFSLNVETRPLADVEAVWAEPWGGRRRIVFTTGA